MVTTPEPYWGIQSPVLGSARSTVQSLLLILAIIESVFRIYTDHFRLATRLDSLPWQGMLDYTFKLDFQVRDYECDMQGIVNNSVYQNYLEHTRHEFLKTLGIDFAEVTRRKIHLVVIRCELDYKYPLRSGDRFWVGLNLEQLSRIRFAFLQDLYRYPDNRLILNATIIGTAINDRGRPELPPEIEKAIGRHSMKEISDRNGKIH